jgi:hypothetical protein
MTVHRSPDPLTDALAYARDVQPATLSKHGHVIVVTCMATGERRAFVPEGEK